MTGLVLISALAAAAPSEAEIEGWLDAVIAGQDALPALADVQRWAEAALALPAPEDVEAWSSRARWAGLLPRLDVRFGSQRDLLVRDSIDGLDWARNGQGFGVDVAARWGLSTLLYAGEEPGLHRERLRRAAALRLARARVTELYFERVEVLLELRAEVTSEGLLRAAALDGRLSALTGGRYSARRRS